VELKRLLLPVVAHGVRDALGQVVRVQFADRLPRALKQADSLPAESEHVESHLGDVLQEWANTEAVRDKSTLADTVGETVHLYARVARVERKAVALVLPELSVIEQALNRGY